jgi:hypothetical protein
MSYDFNLFTARAGIDARDIVDAEVEEFARGARNPKIEAQKRKVASALIAFNAQLERVEPDFDEISKLHKIPIAEAQERHRHVELMDEAAGVQVALFDDRASLTIPFWHKGDEARRVLMQAWSYIDIVCREFGFEVYDPQLDRVIDVNAFEDVLSEYASVTARMETLIGRAPKKPWWKFW